MGNTENVSARDAWLFGGEETLDPSAQKPERAYRLILLGAPGAGKGTQAEKLVQSTQARQLSTGDVFRAALKSGEENASPAMKEALSYMKQGLLVPSATVIGLVRERIGCLKSPYGFLLDGFPRTVVQADALVEMLKDCDVQLDGVLNYELTMDDVLLRLGGRRTCRGCGWTCHMTFGPPQKEGVCDKCGGELYTRDDDQPESIKVRLEAYRESTCPLEDYYRERGLLISIDASGAPDQVFQLTMEKLKAL
ncbi:nucleoside monophosphate kinase [Candidatus Sumerlaeota bacterium]|nr:nucleoside monophosphate kinase [Candidatus Sumerlaeota bacterium]